MGEIVRAVRFLRGSFNVMRGKAAIAVLAFCVVGSGCALVRDGTSLACYEMRRKVDEHRESKRNHDWADEAWREAAKHGNGRCNSKDYEAGFKEGFAHFMLRGGNGEPPAIPPSRYRAVPASGRRSSSILYGRSSCRSRRDCTAASLMNSTGLMAKPDEMAAYH